MSAKKKILVIESHLPTATMLVYLLSQAGCEMTVAHTGKSGMQLAEEEKFDLITVGPDSLEINGFEIYRRLKERHISRYTPVVFISERPDETSRRLAKELGVADYIENPFVEQSLAGRILSHAIGK